MAALPRHPLPARGRGPAEIRAIRAPGPTPRIRPRGVLLLRDAVTGAWRWGGGWNTLSADPDAALRAEVSNALREGQCHANTRPGGLPAITRAYGPIHLLIPLLHPP
jgi:hypothetical protein